VTNETKVPDYAQPGRQREALRRRMESDLRQAERQLEDFRAKLAEDPFYAFGWADGAFLAAARRQVLSRYAAWMDLEEKAPALAELVAELRRDLTSKAQYVHNRSTGQSSNRLADCELGATAELLEQAERRLEAERG
jgi:hypothetical protein